jgi:hypothetical protein
MVLVSHQAAVCSTTKLSAMRSSTRRQPAKSQPHKTNALQSAARYMKGWAARILRRLRRALKITPREAATTCVMFDDKRFCSRPAATMDSSHTSGSRFSSGCRHAEWAAARASRITKQRLLSEGTFLNSMQRTFARERRTYPSLYTKRGLRIILSHVGDRQGRSSFLGAQICPVAPADKRFL